MKTVNSTVNKILNIFYFLVCEHILGIENKKNLAFFFANWHQFLLLQLLYWRIIFQSLKERVHFWKSVAGRKHCCETGCCSSL